MSNDLSMTSVGAAVLRVLAATAAVAATSDTAKASSTFAVRRVVSLDMRDLLGGGGGTGLAERV
jgi:hypothetical protein